MPARLSLTGLSPSLAGFPKTILLGSLDQSRGPNPGMLCIPVWAPPISLAATLEITLVFSSSGYLDVSVHRVPLPGLWIGPGMPGGFPGGFPHSDISGSMGICPSPKLFAAYHVFHRLLVPRHPPYALISITNLPSGPRVGPGLHMHSVACVGGLRFFPGLLPGTLPGLVMFVNITSDVSDRSPDLSSFILSWNQ